MVVRRQISGLQKMPSLARKATDIPLLTASQLYGPIPLTVAVIATSRIVEESRVGDR